MTIIRANTAEGGTNGTTVSTGNSGGASGNAWDLVNIPAGQTLTYTASAFAGSHGFDVGTDTGTVAGAQMRWGDALALTQGALRAFVYLPATAPSVTAIVAQVSTNNSGTIGSCGKLAISPSGKLALQDAAGTTLWNSPSVLPTGQWLRLELWAIPGTTTSNGQLAAGWASGAAALSESFTSTATANAGTGPIGRASFGKLSGTWSTVHVLFDRIAVADTAAFIGNADLNVAPTANAGLGQTDIEPWASVTLSGSDSDSDGTVVTRAWTQIGGTPTVTLSGASTATATFPAAATIAGTTLTFQYAVTDNSGATTTATTTVAVLPVTERAAVGGVEVPMRVSL